VSSRDDLAPISEFTVINTGCFTPIIEMPWDEYGEHDAWLCCHADVPLSNYSLTVLP